MTGEDAFLIEIQDSFLQEAQDLIDKTESIFLSLEKSSDPVNSLDELKRLAHNFKGSAKAVGFDSLSHFCHQMENLMVCLSSGSLSLSANIVGLLLKCNDILKNDVLTLKTDRKAIIDHQGIEAEIEAAMKGSDLSVNVMPQKAFAPVAKKAAHAGGSLQADKVQQASGPTDNSIRIPLKRIDDLLNVFGEQVILLSVLDHYKEDYVQNQEQISRTIISLKKLAFDMQNSTMTLRNVSLKGLFGKLERAVRDGATLLDKQIHCEFHGGHHELDKTIIDQISDPLTHLIRNAVDHGVEGPTERQAAGKTPQGTVQVHAKKEGGRFVIEIADDGKGLDASKIKQKAIEKGLTTEEAQLSDKEIYDFIFMNEFSTKEVVSEISGRGVGMNVVKQMINNLNGSIEIETSVGHGTTFRLKLPMSLSLFNGLLFEINQDRYVVPSSQVNEIINFKSIPSRSLDEESGILQVHDSSVEYFDLVQRMGRVRQSEENQKKSMILITEVAGEKVALRVHRVLGIQRIVQKGLSPEMNLCPGASGVTILGDGKPAMILDLRLIYRQLFGRLDAEGAA